MKNVSRTDKELLFEESVMLTGFTEYGFSLNDLAAGTKPIPPEGARFDIEFEGDVKGDKVQGKIKGTDFLEVRSDGRFFLSLQATIITHDGVNIKVKETGINKNGELRLNMEFHTNDSKYSWLNNEQVLGVGTVDFNTGKAKVNGYLIKNQ